MVTRNIQSLGWLIATSKIHFDLEKQGMFQKMRLSPTGCLSSVTIVTFPRVIHVHESPSHVPHATLL